MDIGANETQFGIGSDPILDLMKNFASQKGEAMLSKEFGPYSNPGGLPGCWVVGAVVVDVCVVLLILDGPSVSITASIA